MAIQILENYLESIRHLPSDLQRNFSLMLELDHKVETIQKNVDELVEKYKCEVKQLDEKSKSKIIKEIQKYYLEMRKHSDDKVELSYGTYELVDKHIRHLDSDLNRYENTLKRKDKTFSASESTSSKKRSISESSRPSKQSRSVSEGSHKSSVTSRLSSKSEEINKESPKNEELDMPVDPNEPTYCLCHQVSFGQMVGCDNNDCTIEWFHFECVGLSSQPVGEWFCPKCTEKNR